MSCQRRIEYFSLLTLEVWKYGNVSLLSLSINSGSVEIWNVEMCLGQVVFI